MAGKKFVVYRIRPDQLPILKQIGADERCPLHVVVAALIGKGLRSYRHDPRRKARIARKAKSARNAAYYKNRKAKESANGAR